MDAGFGVPTLGEHGLLASALASAALTAVPPIETAAPFLFAAIGGAVAVAGALAATALGRRLRAARRDVADLRARLASDLGAERLFLVEPGRLMPASPATERYVRRAHERRQDQAAADDDAATSPFGPQSGRATLLREMFGRDTAERITPLLGRLATSGAPFEVLGDDAEGLRWRFQGETVGARAVLRLWPVSAAETDVGAEPADAPAAPAGDAAADRRRFALERVATGVALFDGESRLVYANAAARRLLRLEVERLGPHPSLRALLDHLVEAGRAPYRADLAAWREALLEDPVGALSRESVWRLSGGEALSVTAEPTPAEGFALYVADETGAQDLDRRYKVALGAQRRTIAAIEEGLAVFGVDGRLQLLNPAFARLWGLDPTLAEERRAGQATLDDIVGQAVRDEADAVVWGRIRAAAEPGAAARGRRRERFAAARADDRRLAVRITPLPDGGTLVTCSDMSDTHRAERALREKAEALEAADRLKTEFLHDVAYRLRTPLNAVIGFADMLRQGMAGPLDKRQLDYVGHVLTAAGEIRELVSDALDLGARSAGAAADPEATATVDLVVLTRGVVALLAKRAERRGARLELAASTTPLLVAGAEDRLRHAVFSAGSAVLADAAPGDAVRIGVTRAAEGEHVEGPIARLEARLRRRHPLGAAPSAAAGAGLALARRIVEAHGGRGMFEESADGALAVLEFPLRAPSADASDAAA